MANKLKGNLSQAIDFPSSARVHIASEHGSEISGFSNDFKTNDAEPHSDLGVKCTARGCSSAVERPVHIGKVRSSILRTPTISRFKSIHDTGFADHFWSRVAIGSPAHCWPWMQSTNSDGYGQTKVGGRYWTASRLAYALAYGADAADCLVCHHCDNRACCNPAHLYAGTKNDNEKDKFARGRVTHRGEHNKASKLTQEQIGNIRNLFSQGLNNTAIGKMLGVHHSTISKIRTGKSWAVS